MLFLLRKVSGYGMVGQLPFQWVLGAVSFELKCVKCSIEVKNVSGIYLAALHIHGSVLMHGDDTLFIITGWWKSSILVHGSFR
jgi:hypothetical protein